MSVCVYVCVCVCERGSRAIHTRCHFPTMAVEYPTDFKPSAIVVSLNGKPVTMAVDIHSNDLF